MIERPHGFYFHFAFFLSFFLSFLQDSIVKTRLDYRNETRLYGRDSIVRNETLDSHNQNSILTIETIVRIESRL